MLRTNNCGELTKEDAGKKVKLAGWVDRSRDLGQLFFISLRDRYGTTQCVYEADSHDDSQILSDLKSLTNESVIQILGTVKERSEKDTNKAQKTGSIEVVIEGIEILNRAKELPFQLRDSHNTSQEIRLKHRYLDLRTPRMQHNLMIRHKVIQIVRRVLSDMDFLEIETPLLIRSTPEGARDFVVPSRTNPGKFYALPQSPQLYKQLLMVSGCDRYFQFAPAFRDEDLRADRVPVHTQIDMEMTFVEEQDVFKAVEAYVTAVFKELLNIDLDASFQVMPYHVAMEDYGIDKPDLRFGLKLKTITDIAKKSGFKVFESAAAIRSLVVPGADQFTRKKIDELTEVAGVYGAKGLAWTKYKDGEFQGGVGRFLEPIKQELLLETGVKDNEIIFFVADTYQVACSALAQIRLKVGKELDLIDKDTFKFVWINDFPLFEWSEKRGAFDAMHHLFTMPKKEDISLLESDPGKVKGQLYDLVLNGVELLSGSIRINNHEMQEKILDIVKMPKEEAMGKFGFLMDSFKYGAPPHGGSAMGLDRLVAILCSEASIREVIAYPCNHMGVFPLDGSPAEISGEQLQELHIQLDVKDKK